MNTKVMLRELRADDAERMLEWMHDDSVMRWLQFDGKSKTIEDARYFISNANHDNENIHRAIITDDGVYRGTISLKSITNKEAELAVAMCRDSIGKGYGTLAIGEMLLLAFEELQLNRVFLTVKKDNTRAMRAYEKNGFTLVGMDGNQYKYQILNRKKPVMLEFVQRGDERGHLVVVEGAIDVPFSIKRVFYIYGSSADVVRGKHANRNSEFVLVNVAGKSKIRTETANGDITIFNLDRPHTGIYIPKMVWKEMYDFSPDSVLLCLSSEHYDAKEYIRDYDEFVKVSRMHL